MLVDSSIFCNQLQKGHWYQARDETDWLSLKLLWNLDLINFAVNAKSPKQRALFHFSFRKVMYLEIKIKLLILTYSKKI